MFVPPFTLVVETSKFKSQTLSVNCILSFVFSSKTSSNSAIKGNTGANLVIGISYQPAFLSCLAIFKSVWNKANSAFWASLSSNVGSFF